MFTTVAKKKSIIGFLLFAVAAVVIWNYTQRNSPTENTFSLSYSNAKAVLPDTTNETATVSLEVSQPSTKTQLAAAQKTQRLMEPAEMAEVNAWFRKHGRYETNDDYANYDQKTLENLTANGDIQAMHVLSRMYMDSDHYLIPEYGFNGADKLHKNAAIHGSTQAFTELAISHEVRFYDSEKDPAAKRAAGLEVMALYEAQGLRGDKWAGLIQGDLFKKRLQPTSEEQAIIDKRAQQIIDELQQKRIELGLGKFDNSVPDVVTKFFNRLEEQPL